MKPTISHLSRLTAVVQYLLEEAGAPITAHAVRGAIDNRSIPLFELFLKHGYHPNQQIPSNRGCLGTALQRCLDNDAITFLLLESGTDPNIAPISDLRKRTWSERAVVPMDRTSGLPLDTAMAKSSFAVIKKLLDCLNVVVLRREIHSIADSDRPQEVLQLRNPLLRLADRALSTRGIEPLHLFRLVSADVE